MHIDLSGGLLQVIAVHENIDLMLYRIDTTKAGVSIWLAKNQRLGLSSLLMVRSGNQLARNIINYTILRVLTSL